MRVTAMETIPAETMERLRRQYGGKQAERWVPVALQRARRVAKECGVTVTEFMPGGAASLVFAGMLKGKDVVVKVPHPSRASAEVTALLLCDGYSVPEIFYVAEDASAYVMERVMRTAQPVTAADVAQVAFRIQRTPQPGFPDLIPAMKARISWSWERYYSSADSAHQAEFARACHQIESLIATTVEPVLLHGDLTSKNLIPSKDGLIAIDPWPANGDPAFDIAFYLAWREHFQPTVDEWTLVSNPRVDAWTWALSVIERSGEDRHREDREELIRLTASSRCTSQPAGTAAHRDQ